jgi:hypothetical protein
MQVYARVGLGAARIAPPVKLHSHNERDFVRDANVYSDREF